MNLDGLGLLEHSNRNLEQVLKVLGLFCVDIRGVVGFKDFGKADSKQVGSGYSIVKDRITPVSNYLVT